MGSASYAHRRAAADDTQVIARKLNLAACVAIFSFAALPATAGADVNVCNEAENSWHARGYGRRPTAPSIRIPSGVPARLADEGSAYGHWRSAWSTARLMHSPALRVCGPEEVDPTDPDDGGGGPIQAS